MVDFSKDGAIFDETRAYRHLLWRKGTKPLAWVCLNPSNGDEGWNDNSLKSMIRISEHHGFSGIIVGNLHDVIETDSEKLKRHPKPISEANPYYLGQIAKISPFVVCAWGNKGDLIGQDLIVMKLFSDHGVKMKCLRISKMGMPEHPLYKPKNNPLFDFGFDTDVLADAQQASASEGKDSG